MQQIEISDGQSGSSFPKYISNHKSHLRSNVFCSDHHHELNFFAAVHKNSGMYVIVLCVISQLFSKLDKFFFFLITKLVKFSSKVKKYIM